ncbi:MAG: hypothetical protein LBU23_09590 [Planctomycetota bacterium]|jgi:hypothetical protein|nr:hypothetical protein [Planctomycetota bacterium]
MTTIEKKMEIPENRRLPPDLIPPADIPPGTAEVKATIIPVAAKRPNRKPFVGLAGSLAETRDFAGDALEMQRETRGGQPAGRQS